MSISSYRKIYLALLGLVFAIMAAAPATAAELYESDPTLALLGNCETLEVDPILDPSCPYPAPPAGPTGRFEQPRALAIDQHGNQYVASFANGDDAKGRVDVFDEEGRFITEFAAEDAQTASVDSEGVLYIYRSSGEVVRYVPSEYEPEEGEIAYANAPVLVASGPSVGSVAVDAANDQVLIARENKIRLYKTAADAEPNGLSETYEPAGLALWHEAMVVDEQRRRIYVSFCADANEECGIKVLDADDPEVVLETIDGSTVPAEGFASFSGRLPVAVDEGTGDFFIADPLAKMIYRFSEGYEFLAQQPFDELFTGSRQIAISNGTRSLAAEPCEYPTAPPPAAGDACNRHYLFVPVFKNNGRLAAFHLPNQLPPAIEGVATPSIGETEAELEATIFPGGLATEYHFEITALAAWEANEFSGATIIPGGTIAANSLAREVSVFATGLTPGQSYRFRAVAENELGPAEEEGQNEATFATYNDAPIASGCPNEALRLGPSALLPDCRAYELVTPADTSGRPPKGTGELGSTFSTLQASPAGEAVSFKILGGSLPGSSGVASFEGDAYVARRAAAGWSTKLEGPSGAEVTNSAPGSFSPGQSYSFWRSLGEGPLGPVGIIYAEYLHYPDGHSELIGRGSLGTYPPAEGNLIAEGGAHVIFSTAQNLAPTPVQLEPNAPPDGTEAVYDRTIDPVTGAEKTHTVSLLPSNVTPAEGEDAIYEGASADGEGIAFSIGNKLYLRVGNETSFEVGEGVEFAGVSEGGERVFYLEGGDLKALDTTGGPPGAVVSFSALGNVTPVNVSRDGARAFFVSPTVLGGTNPEGDSAQPGEQNLYLSEQGAISFVATVTDRDVEGEPVGVDDGLGLWTKFVSSQPAKDPSRLNPDGSVLLFQSRAEITGYPASEFPQIYRYDSDGGTLQCISCIPTGTPPSGGASLETYSSDAFAEPPFSAYGFVPNLNPDGTRALFESSEALVSTDTDEVMDVYEWEANGVGSCTRPGGCVYLISSGQSEQPNFLYGHSTSGNDVFFTTGDTLTGWDSAAGAISIYDARVGGGFPEPPEPEGCVGDGCRPSVTPAPVFEKPKAGGEGNLPVKARKTCPKAKRKVKKNGKVRCIRKKSHKKHKGKNGKPKRRAGANRGAGK